jgi:hypothetical protein
VVCSTIELSATAPLSQTDFRGAMHEMLRPAERRHDDSTINYARYCGLI